MNRLDGLDALRGVAALMVLIGHTEHLYATKITGVDQNLAVDFFFMLSGYVLARTYEGKFAQGYAAFDFARKRFVRFYPIMATGAVLGLLAFWSHWPPALSLIFFGFGMLLMPVFTRESSIFPQNPPAWSIFVELIANVLHAAILWRLGWKTLLAISAVCACLLRYHSDSLTTGYMRADFALALLRIGITYPIGIVLYRLTQDRVSVPLWLGLALLIGWPLLHLGAWATWAFVLICPVIVLSGIRAQSPAPLVWLGTISFPLYALHYPVVMLTRGVLPLPLTIVTAILCAWLATLVFDGTRRMAAPARA